MSILARKERGIYHFNGLSKLSAVSLITAISAAFIDTIWAVYLYGFFKNEIFVGFFSSFLTVVSFISYFLFIPLIEKKDKSKIFIWSLYLCFITYLFLAFNKNFFLMIMLSILLTLFYVLRITSFGIIIKDKCSGIGLSKSEGAIYSIRNLGWVIGPIIAGYILSLLGMNYVFIISAVFLLIGIFVFHFSKIKDRHIVKKADTKIIKNFFDFFKNKNRLIAYILGAGVSLWWGFIYLFIPIEIIRSGLNELWIGYFLFAIAFPLIILEYPFSKWAGNHGFKKLFKIGYFIVAVISAICFFISNIYIVLGLLVLASLGMAMIEPISETYFLNITKGKEIYRFYGPYYTSIESGRFIGKITISLLLVCLPFKFSFLLLAGFMLFFFLLSFRMKDIIEKKKK